MTKTATRSAPKERTILSPIEFVNYWQGSENLDEFCATTGMAKPSAAGRANGYRKKGVNLKLYPRKSPVRLPLDVAGLNAAIAALGD